MTDTSKDIVINLANVDRETGLRCWLVYHGISKKQVADALGISQSSVSRIIKGERRRPEHIRKLKEMGIPEELLP